MDPKLEGKVVMVTGASSGLGREVCLDLAAAGCRIVAAARRIDRLRSLCDQINGSGGSTSSVQAVFIELNVSAGSAAIEAAAAVAWESFGRIDVLVNNAGVRGGIHAPLDWPEEEWGIVFRTNVTGLWLVSKHVCRRMLDAKQKGSIINISSILGLDRPQPPGSLAYSASKACVNAITRAMALELGKYNIRVNSISLGIFKSEITKGLVEKEWLNKVAKKIVPLQTFGTSDPALTSLVRHLVDDSSEYITGNVFVADAGTILPGVPIYSSL